MQSCKVIATSWREKENVKPRGPAVASKKRPALKKASVSEQPSTPDRRPVSEKLPRSSCASDAESVHEEQCHRTKKMRIAPYMHNRRLIKQLLPESSDEAIRIHENILRNASPRWYKNHLRELSLPYNLEDDLNVSDTEDEGDEVDKNGQKHPGAIQENEQHPAPPSTIQLPSSKPASENFSIRLVRTRGDWLCTR